MKHFGLYEDELVLLLGYNKSNENVLILRVDDISPGAETESMLAFIQSRLASDSYLAADAMREPSVNPNLPITRYYQSKPSSSKQGTCLLQVPGYLVSMFDKEQCMSWTGNEARWASKVPESDFLNRLRQGGNLGLTETVVSVDINTAQSRPIGTTEDNSTSTTQPLPDISANRMPETLEELQERFPAVNEDSSDDTDMPISLYEPSNKIELATSLGSRTAQPTSTDPQIDLLKRIAEGLDTMNDGVAEMNGKLENLGKRSKDQDTSLRSIARELKSSGLKVSSPPTEAARSKKKKDA